MENKNKKFKRIAEKRVNNALKQLDLIGNLSNRYIYDYSDEEINYIIKALDKKIRDIKGKFSQKSDNDVKFSLIDKKGGITNE